MSNAIPPILVQIAADVSQLKAGLAQAESSIKGMNGSVATSNTGMQNMIGTAKKMAGAMGIAFAATQVIQFGKDVVMSASSMNESISKVNVVFGKSADAVFKFGDSAAKSMGMSNQSAIEAAGTYGNLFQAFGIGQGKATEMSTTLVKLAADLGSFNNTSTEEAINALRSGLAGETEPLKRYGVALNEVTLKNKALAMGFGEIKGAMDPAIKAQVTYALVLEQTKLAQGDYERTASGTANTMKTLGAQFADTKVIIGNLVLPAFNALLQVTNVLIIGLKEFAGFVQNNADGLKAFALIMGIATAAFYGYKAAMIAVTVSQEAYVLITAIMKGATLTSIASTNGLAASMLMLNAAMRANPIYLIVTAIMAAGVAFVYAYKRFETFRNIINKGLQVIINGFGYFLGFLSTVVGALGKLPGMGAFKGMADGLSLAANKARNLSDALTAVKYASGTHFTYGEGNPLATAAGSTASKGGAVSASAAAAAKKTADAIKKTLKDVAEAYKDMNKVIADAQDKVAEAGKKRDESVFEANKRYKEELAKAHKKYNETIESEDKRLLEATAAAYKRNKEQLESINKDYAKRTSDIEQKLQETIANVRQKAVEKSADLIQKSVDKQQEIIQRSIDRLRDAFSSKTGFSLVNAFGNGNTTGTDLLAALKKKMESAKDLVKKAGLLQAQGFSQTFIEQIVSAGPEVGNNLADAILASSPETNKALNASFVEMENVSNHGLDALAISMNSGANLATEELRKAYAAVAVDLKASLAEVNKEMNKSLAEANKNYSEAMAEAQADRDDKLAEAAKDLAESLAEANKNYKEAVAEAKKNLNEALAESAKTLTESLADIQKTYNEALRQIAKNTQERIDTLKDKLKELADQLVELGAKHAAIMAIINAPVYKPVVPVVPTPPTPPTYVPSPNPGGGTPGSTFPDKPAPYEDAIFRPGGMGSRNSTVSVNQNNYYPSVSASEIAAQTVNAIKFGTLSGGGR